MYHLRKVENFTGYIIHRAEDCCLDIWNPPEVIQFGINSHYKFVVLTCPSILVIMAVRTLIHNGMCWDAKVWIYYRKSIVFSKKEALTGPEYREYIQDGLDIDLYDVNYAGYLFVHDEDAMYKLYNTWCNAYILFDIRYHQLGEEITDSIHGEPPATAGHIRKLKWARNMIASRRENAEKMTASLLYFLNYLTSSRF